MQPIKDRLVLGLIAGVGANLLKEAIGETGVRSGLTKYTCRRMIPMLLLNKKDAKTWKGWIIGTTTDMTVAGMIGVLTTYTLSYTGKDYASLKGIMISNGILDQFFTLFARALPQVKKDPNSNLLCRTIHTVFGITAASIITSLGDPSLFGEQPEQQKVREQQEIAQINNSNHSTTKWE